MSEQQSIPEHIVGINQPYYLPYIGVFDRASFCDTFVINEYSPIKREKSSHRRTRIIQTHPTAPDDTILLSQEVSKKYECTPFDEIPLTEGFWKTQKEHAQTIYGIYKRSKGFTYASDLLALMEEKSPQSLGDYNTRLILHIAEKLGIESMRPIRELPITKEEAKERVERGEVTNATVANLAVCRRLEATKHITGQNAPLWLDEQTFHDAGVDVAYQKVGFIPYPQFNRRKGEFTQGISAIDLLFNNGERSREYIGKGSQVVDRNTLTTTTILTGR